MGKIVIIGAGIIGCSTAFYLSRSRQIDPRQISLIEASDDFFQSASGFAGGLLSKDRFCPPLAELGALSFDLHKRLAEENGGQEKWGYGSSTLLSIPNPNDPSSKKTADWLRAGSVRASEDTSNQTKQGTVPLWMISPNEEVNFQLVADRNNAAQLDPLRLCNFLLQELRNSGVQVYQPCEVISTSKDNNGNLNRVRLRYRSGSVEDIDCGQLILCAGVWTPKIFSALFPYSQICIPVEALAGHSILVRSPRWSKEHEEGGLHAVYAAEVNGFSPGIMSRRNSELYVAGANDTRLHFPKYAGQQKIDCSAIEKLRKYAALVLQEPDQQDDMTVTREALCFRPVTQSGMPIICQIPTSQLGNLPSQSPANDMGVYVAVGHGTWGISLALGTGYVMMELIEGRNPTVDISALGLTYE